MLGATKPGPNTSRVSIACGRVSFMTRCFKVDTQEVQKGRVWSYVVGIVIFVAAVVWRFLTHH